MTNTFNKEKYYIERAELIEEIKESLPDWQKSQGFFADGIYAPDIYEKQKLKILVLLSETYGYLKYKMTDIERLENLNEPKSHVRIVPTINKISKLLWVINKSISENKELSFDTLPGSYNNTDKLKEQLLKIAWVNIKKESGMQSNQNVVALYEHARKNEKILLKQITSIAPDLIIVCGDVAINCACHFNLLGTGVTSKKKNHIQTNESGQKIIFLPHPAARRGQWGYRNIFSYYKTVYTAIKDETTTQ